jgi:alkane 1-monooxygenase
MNYTYNQQGGKPAAYADPKRYLFPLVLALNFSTPFVIMGLYWGFGQNPLWVLALPIYFFCIIPLLDVALGEDTSNPPDDVFPELSDDNYYRVILWINVPMFYVIYIAGIWFLMTQGLPVWAQIVFALGLGLVNGNVNTIAHELGHKTNRIDQLFSRLALITIGNGHFAAEHNLHHHTRVSTPEDCSSARMGESLYAFALRDIPGALKGGWALEKARLSRKGHSTFSFHNQLLINWSASVALAIALALWLGWSALFFIAIYKFVAFFILTLANYIEHYGLLRQKLPNGRYEPCAPRHSWNTNHLFSNLSTIHLQRHSDHHANPMRPYQSLRSFDDLPELPSGYPGCFFLALIPQIWFRVMGPKVLAWAGGDMAKVNVQPGR